MSRRRRCLLLNSQAFTKLRALLVLVLIVVSGGVGWFLLRARQPIRNVILISIDTCRADHLSCYGFGRKNTPNIDAIAREGILFKNALTPTPLTLPAHSSMLTGTYPPARIVRSEEFAVLSFEFWVLSCGRGGTGICQYSTSRSSF